MDKKDFMTVLPLSCVEHYFLAWLKLYGVPEGLCYHRSFLSLEEVAADFFDNGALYETYEKAERVMHLAKDYGMTDMEALTEADPCAVESAWAAESLVLAQVNDRFFADRAMRPRRTDHFIALTGRYGADGYTYLNQYPLGIGVLTGEAFRASFGGKVLIYRLLGIPNMARLEADEATQFHKILHSHCERLPKDISDARAMRDCIGVLRIGRRRLQCWLRYIAAQGRFCYDTPLEALFDDYFRKLDRLFVRAEATHLRNTKPLAFEDALAAIAYAENEMIGMIATRRDNHDGE